MREIDLLFILVIVVHSCNSFDTDNTTNDWSISVLPSSVRLNPLTNEIIDQRFILLKDQKKDLLKSNAIYDGDRISLFAARGEYVSFQLVVTNNTDKTLEGIRINVPAFNNNKTYSWLSWGAGAGWIKGRYDPESWKDAYKEGSESDSTFTYKKLNGNALLIYCPGVIPNISGVCPSIRLKTMRDGVQEYEYMRLLSVLDNNRERVDAVVNSIIKDPFGPKGIGNLDVWSHDAEQWDKGRIELGKLIDKANKNK